MASLRVITSFITLYGLFDEPSRQPIPQPALEDLKYSGGKALASMIPFVGGAGAELIGLLSGPVGKRRDSWLEDLQRRLQGLEGRVGGFQFDDLANNEQFVSATLQATQAALRTHQAEKLEALRNAVLNAAVEKSANADRQSIFISLVERLTPAHLCILKHLRQPSLAKQYSGFLSWKVESLVNEKKRWKTLLRWVRDHCFESKDYSQEFIKLLLSDLYSTGLINIHPNTELENVPTHGTTEIGDGFFDFITSPLDRTP